MVATTDIDGATIRAGDTVILLGLPPFLTDGLPDDDVHAIKGQVGRILKVAGFNEVGWIELEFHDASGGFHFIWVEGEYLRRTIA